MSITLQSRVLTIIWFICLPLCSCDGNQAGSKPDSNQGNGQGIGNRLDEGARGAVKDYFSSKMVDCGNKRYFFHTHNLQTHNEFDGEYHEVRGPKYDARPLPRSEADEYNGIEWQGIGFLNYSAYRNCKINEKTSCRSYATSNDHLFYNFGVDVVKKKNKPWEVIDTLQRKIFPAPRCDLIKAHPIWKEPNE